MSFLNGEFMVFNRFIMFLTFLTVFYGQTLPNNSDIIKIDSISFKTKSYKVIKRIGQAFKHAITKPFLSMKKFIVATNRSFWSLDDKASKSITKVLKALAFGFGM